MNENMFYQSGDGSKYPYSIDLDFPEFSSPRKTDIYVRWIEIMLETKCKFGWNLEAYELPLYHSLTGIKIYFQNPGECIFFKLGNTIGNNCNKNLI